MLTMLNFGGVGVLAFVLFWLHRDALSWFREELRKERESREKAMADERADHDNALKAEREQTQAMWKFYMDLKVRQHEQVMGALVAQDKVLSGVLAEVKNQRQGGE